MSADAQTKPVHPNQQRLIDLAREFFVEVENL